jgi:2-iminobutanoate/2-iminopropanoate deaminase
VSKRRAIEVEGLHHEHPIPSACRIGPFVASGGISGKDPNNGKHPANLEEQCALMFANMRRIIEAAGGTPDDIIKITVWMQDPAQRQLVNKEWLAMFPNPESRPARHTMASQGMPPGAQVQCEFLAVLSKE